MSGVAIVRALLVLHAPLLAVVPASRIKAGVPPLGTALPCIGITRVSGQDRNIVKPRSTVRVTERVQITVMASTYPQQEAVMALARKACRDKQGTYAGYTGCLVLTYSQGPDDSADDGSGIYVGTQDFSVAFIQTP
jgi:hypothetical protein